MKTIVRGKLDCKNLPVEIKQTNSAKGYSSTTQKIGIETPSLFKLVDEHLGNRVPPKTSVSMVNMIEKVDDANKQTYLAKRSSKDEQSTNLLNQSPGT
ncbi:hypothetical protein JCGZ_08287 [Jatropha curcas]|uniref:Uncharacterized protein n=1 Tax=Jatropha curcas TaxID=180498 RepID=A0A067KMI0_JATCU|nr:hypothetical protein JCGZ_08287 [Jatropha curcas]